MYSVVFAKIKYGFRYENQGPKTSQTFWRKQASKRLECRKSNEADAGSIEELVFGGRNFDRSGISPLEKVGQALRQQSDRTVAQCLGLKRLLFYVIGIFVIIHQLSKLSSSQFNNT